MPVIAMFGGLFCSTEEIAQKVGQALDVPICAEEIVDKTAARCNIAASKVRRALEGSRSFFDNITHERKRVLTQLRLSLAEELRNDNFVCLGSAIHLIPQEVSHVLRVCVVADKDYRLAQGKAQGHSAEETEKAFRSGDEALNNWTRSLLKRGPWDASLYDLKIPVHSTSLDGAVELILANATKDALKPTRASLQAVLDFTLAMRTNLALLEEGHHYCDVKAQGGEVTVIINKNVLRMERLSRELKRIASLVEGVDRVQTQVGPGYNRPNIVYGDELAAPSKYLLVDDEKEFALTLSERLELRDFNSEVAYGGQEALEYVEKHEPRVMVLDLRMPGMGGMEVLRRIKKDHPRVQVIILTGHGSAKDKEEALASGAFAYLQKPVDINTLVETMQAAEEAGQQGGAEQGSEAAARAGVGGAKAGAAGAGGANAEAANVGGATAGEVDAGAVGAGNAGDPDSAEQDEED